MRYILRVIFVSTIFFSFSIPLPAFAQPPPQRILIGILPEINVFKQKQRFKLLGDYLTKKTGVTVKFTILSRYGNIFESFTSEKMDGAFLGSFTGALAIKRLGVIPLVRIVNLDGTTSYHGYLFVRKDSGIKVVKEMKGKKMAYVDKATAAGYLFPVSYLKENGVTDPDRFFRETFFTGSHDASINAVLKRKADVGAAKHSVYDQVKINNPLVDRQLLVLAKSVDVPSSGLFVRSDLDETIKTKLKTILLNIDSDPEGRTTLQQLDALKFIETTVNDYQPVFDMARKSGIDILKYKYNR